MRPVGYQYHFRKRRIHAVLKENQKKIKIKKNPVSKTMPDSFGL